MNGKILVTGGAGYIGSHVVVSLAEAGYTPLVLDSFVNSSRAVVPRLAELCGRPVETIVADVRDVEALRRTFHDHAIAGVVHCAGLKSVAEGQARPLAYWDVNVGGTIALAEVMGDRCWVSCQLGARKPEPLAFARLAERLQLPVERILFVDDSSANCEGARRAGLQALHFREEAEILETLTGLLGRLSPG